MLVFINTIIHYFAILDSVSALISELFSSLITSLWLPHLFQFIGSFYEKVRMAYTCKQELLALFIEAQNRLGWKGP